MAILTAHYSERASTDYAHRSGACAAAGRGVSARDPDAPCLELPLQLGALRLRTVYAAHLGPELRR